MSEPVLGQHVPWPRELGGVRVLLYYKPSLGGRPSGGCAARWDECSLLTSPCPRALAELLQPRLKTSGPAPQLPHIEAAILVASGALGAREALQHAVPPTLPAGRRLRVP